MYLVDLIRLELAVCMVVASSVRVICGGAWFGIVSSALLLALAFSFLWLLGVLLPGAAGHLVPRLCTHSRFVLYATWRKQERHGIAMEPKFPSIGTIDTSQPDRSG